MLKTVEAVQRQVGIKVKQSYLSEDIAAGNLLLTEYVNLDAVRLALRWTIGLEDVILDKRALAEYRVNADE